MIAAGNNVGQSLQLTIPIRVPKPLCVNGRLVPVELPAKQAYKTTTGKTLTLMRSVCVMLASLRPQHSACPLCREADLPFHALENLAECFTSLPAFLPSPLLHVTIEGMLGRSIFSQWFTVPSL